MDGFGHAQILLQTSCYFVNLSNWDGYHVWLENFRGNKFIIEKLNGTIPFHRVPNGLYQHDAAQKAMFIVTTTKGNKEGYTHWQKKKERRLTDAHLAW